MRDGPPGRRATIRRTVESVAYPNSLRSRRPVVLAVGPSGDPAADHNAVTPPVMAWITAGPPKKALEERRDPSQKTLLVGSTVFSSDVITAQLSAGDITSAAPAVPTTSPT